MAATVAAVVAAVAWEPVVAGEPAASVVELAVSVAADCLVLELLHAAPTSAKHRAAAVKRSVMRRRMLLVFLNSTPYVGRTVSGSHCVYFHDSKRSGPLKSRTNVTAVAKAGESKESATGSDADNRYGSVMPGAHDVGKTDSGVVHLARPAAALELVDEFVELPQA